jgi:hypothetical protein
MPNQGASCSELLVARQTGLVSAFLRSDLTCGIAIVHRVTGETVDSLAGLAFAKTFRNAESPDIVGCQTRAAIGPKAARERDFSTWSRD